MILIKPRNALYNSAMWVWKRFPDQLRRFLKMLEVGNRLRLVGLRYEKRGLWPLKGALKGYRINIENEDQYQFIDRPYEPRVCQAIEKIVKPGWICVDVGAHIGYITLVMCKAVGIDGKVFAFEAVPSNAELLRKNIKLNNLSKRVVIENLAVTEGTCEFVTISPGPSSFESKVSEEPFASSDTSIRAVSLDNYFNENRMPNFIKIDIEGGEVGAILGMKRLLAVTQPIMLIEIHQTCKSTIEELISVGYSFYNLDLCSTVDFVIHNHPRHFIVLPRWASL